MRPIKSAAAALAVLIATCAAVLAPAEAASLTSSGVRCTEVGTPGNDLLVGTAGRDVLCGLGGNDLVKGLGGNDLIDAGGGADTVLAGDGTDRVLGGGGPDDLLGGGGADLLAGGPSGDEIVGGEGSDVLAGQDGNDDLAGGPGGDSVQGGAGTNWCTIDSADERTRCVYDREPARAVFAALSVTTVDVTTEGRRLQVRVRGTDDTGIARVRADFSTGSSGPVGTSSAEGRLVSGDARDGIWRLDFFVQRWSAPGTFPLAVDVQDRVGRWAHHDFDGVRLTVNDRNPDLEPPQVNLLKPLATDQAVDVRSSKQEVVVRARASDAVSGVWYLSMCLLVPQEEYYSGLSCSNAELVSGDIHDGVWRQVITIPRGSTGGDWNVSITAVDRARSGDVHYLGPDDYRLRTAMSPPGPLVRPLPDGRGRFPVIGAHDSTAAVITEVRITPDSVDTLGSDARVSVLVHATDAPGEGVTAVSAGLATTPEGWSDRGAVDLLPVDLSLVSGTPTDGWWQGDLVLSQGTPPGTYYLTAMVVDRRHWRGYAAQPATWDVNRSAIPGESAVVVRERTG